MEQLRKFLLGIKEFYFPAVRRISYRAILLPVVVGLLLIGGASIIRQPQLLSPAPNTTITRTPVFRFQPVRNLFYQGYTVELVYPLTQEEVPLRISEEGAVVVVNVPYRLRRQATVELRITIRKGIGPLTLWQKQFKYKFVTSFQ